MPEVVTASILEKPQPLDERGFEYSTETIAHINAAIMDFLEVNNIDPNSVLFSGFNAEGSKEDYDEHQAEDGTPIFYFGNARSLSPPETLSSDPDIQGEHWVVNPLYYAIPHHTLGIYDKDKLDALTGGDYYGEDPVDVGVFGTYAYALDSATLEQTKIAQLTI
jgi:hypothetical protein